MSKLTVSDLYVRYGKITALAGISFTVEEGERLFISGPNGAGKSSLLRALSGAVGPAQGTVTLDGENLNGKGADSIARMGVSMVPEGREIFGTLTVEENLLVGLAARVNRDTVPADLESVYDAFPILRDRRHGNAGALSGGQQQMLAIGRALMTNPKMLMVDEPSLGLAPKIVDQVYEKLTSLQNERNLTLIIVEQSSVRAGYVGGRMLLFGNGKIVGEGDAADVAAHDSVAQAYFGSSHTEARG